MSSKDLINLSKITKEQIWKKKVFKVLGIVTCRRLHKICLIAVFLVYLYFTYLNNFFLLTLFVKNKLLKSFVFF